jgi:hypothetical protein
MTDPELFRRWFLQEGWLYGPEGNMRDCWQSIAALVAEHCAKIADNQATWKGTTPAHCARAIRSRFVHSPPAKEAP